MITYFRIDQAGAIEGTSHRYLKGVLEEGVLDDRFVGSVEIEGRRYEIEIQGKSLVSIAADPNLKTYVLKVAPHLKMDVERLVGHRLTVGSE